MNGMSTAYVESGRSSQKQRTRTLLVHAARALVAEGGAPTVEAVAERAGTSRATAYRYFPDQAALLAAAHPEVEQQSMLPDPDDPDVGRRLEAVVAAFTELIVRTEVQQRSMLRLSLTESAASGATAPALPLRQGRAIGWISEALAPLRDTMTDDQLGMLVRAVRSATGVEALVWLTDVGGLDRDQARALMRWSARAMLESALRGDPPPL